MNRKRREWKIYTISLIRNVFGICIQLPFSRSLNFTAYLVCGAALRSDRFSRRSYFISAYPLYASVRYRTAFIEMSILDQIGDYIK